MDAPFEPQTTYVTATRRLAHELRRTHHRAHQAQNTVWQDIDVLSWDGWLEQLYRAQPAIAYTLISSAQSQKIWADVITEDIARHDHGNAPLWNIPATARQAMQAWQIALQWRLPFDTPQGRFHPDHRSFSRWAQRYAETLEARQLLDRHRLVHALTEQPPKRHHPMTFIGFDDLSPAQNALIQALKNQGAVISFTPESVPTEQPSPQKHLFDTPDEEWQAVANWAREQLDSAADHGLRIGIVCADLTAQQARAERALSEALCPAQLTLAQTPQSPFHIFNAEPLANTPLVSSALRLLTLGKRIAYPEFATLLTSPFAFSGVPQAQRYRLEYLLRQRAGHTIDLPQLINILRKFDPTPDTLLPPLQALNAHFHDAPKKQALHQWANFFSLCLQRAGWPNTPQLSDTDQLALNAWQQCLRALETLDPDHTPVSRDAAHYELRQLARQSTQQASAHIRLHADAPVQVMTPLEATGVQFDHLWITGLNDQHWPGQLSPNPFLPPRRQREAGIARANLPRLHQLGKQRLHALLVRHPDSHTSFARHDAHNRFTQSAFIAHLSAAAPLAESPTLAQQLCRTPQKSEVISDTQGAPLERSQLKHGTAFFAAQAACPFQAYARHRLQARVAPPPEAGFDALDRGSLVHHVLEALWQELQTQPALAERLNTNDVCDWLDTHIRRIPRLASGRNKGLGGGLAQVEMARLKMLISEWLPYELQRETFEIKGLEQSFNADIGGLCFSVRIDRIDTLADGSLAVIDYKTSLTSANDWTDARLNAPQLPIYTLTLEAAGQTVSSVLFAQIRAGECRYTGLTDHAKRVDGAAPPEAFKANTLVGKDLQSWASTKPLWQERLGALALAIRNGDARVDPKTAQSCEYCDLHALCRIRAATRHTAPPASNAA